MEAYEIILDRIKLFEKLYNVIRVVDPIRKRALELRGHKLFEADLPCYALWKQQQLCENCISIRAFNENDTIYRLEYKDGHIYMFSAIPILIDNQKLVVEILKEATNSLVMGIEDGTKGAEIFTMIEYMNRIAVRDSLTDLYNRRYVSERLPVDILNAAVKGEPLSIVLADLDFFKNINDTYGHWVGDKILKDLAQELKGHIREDKDWVARYGGEEFLICLHNTDNKEAKKIADRIRKSIEKKTFHADGKEIYLTCSFGVYTIHDENENVTVDDIIRLVDQRLYLAKDLGRNRVK